MADDTGVLTQSRMTVKHAYVNNTVIEIDHTSTVRWLRRVYSHSSNDLQWLPMPPNSFYDYEHTLLLASNDFH